MREYLVSVYIIFLTTFWVTRSLHYLDLSMCYWIEHAIFTQKEMFSQGIDSHFIDWVQIVRRLVSEHLWLSTAKYMHFLMISFKRNYWMNDHFWDPPRHMIITRHSYPITVMCLKATLINISSEPCRTYSSKNRTREISTITKQWQPISKIVTFTQNILAWT